LWYNQINDEHWDDGTYIQNYAQWESIKYPGKFSGFTCTAVYSKSNGTTDVVGIVNYTNSASLTNESGNTEGKTWDNQGEINTTHAWFKQDNDAHRVDEAYGRTYKKNDYSTQNCGASGLLHHTVDGEVPEEFAGYEAMYWTFKEASPT